MHDALRAAGFTDLSCFNPDVLRETFTLVQEWRAAVAVQNSTAARNAIVIEDYVASNADRA